MLGDLVVSEWMVNRGVDILDVGGVDVGESSFCEMPNSM